MTKISLRVDGERETLAERFRDFLAFAIRGRYYWVRPLDDGCGPAFASLSEAIEEAQNGLAREGGPLEIIEVRRRDRMRRVWCSEPTLMDAPIKRGPEPGVDFFPREWLEESTQPERSTRGGKASASS